TVLGLRLPPGGAGASLPGGLKVVDPTSALVFEADDPLFVSPAWLELSLAEGTFRGQIWSQSAGQFTNLTSSNCRATYDLMPFGPAPAQGDALWLGFDCSPGAIGQVLSLQAWTVTWATDAAVREALLDEVADREPCPSTPASSNTDADCEDGITLSAQVDDPRPGPFDHYSARLSWEVWDGTVWQPLQLVTDQTRALSLTGPIQLGITATIASDPPQAPSPGRWWIRCRLAAGGYDCPPTLAGIALNAAAVSNAALVTGPETLGVSEGHAQEVFYLQGKVLEQGPNAAAQPVLADTLKLRVVGTGPPDDTWTEVANWDRTGPFDRNYVLDPSENALHLGNGRVGRVAPADWALEALEYRVGGGPAANLPAGRLTQVLAKGTAGLSIMQPFAALGGAVAESLDQAHGRLLERLARPSRGITLADWEDLALRAPGLPVARAKAIPAYLPDLGCWTASGVVTVVIVPSCGKPPIPSSDLLAAVTTFLAPRRPVTTELHVVAPNYVKVTVSATLHVGAPAPQLRPLAQKALDSFFDPLQGGPDGTGWPFGRGILESDLMEILANLPGVLFVDSLRITADSGPSQCDNLSLCPTDLVASQPHQFTVVEGS
ncbi:MAG TPA: putative baseplate assembly protein, partial [Candidatus Dormibacteraeota bacterium]|nr:putative baseplate assembly protein [Candidatus Dormibacteraeota bacterium]